MRINQRLTEPDLWFQHKEIEFQLQAAARVGAGKYFAELLAGDRVFTLAGRTEDTRS